MADEYPRELNLDPIAEQRLIQYLDEELNLIHGERSSYLDQLIEYQKDYWAEPSTENVTFPFAGAAVVIIPLSAITIEATHSRTMTTLFALKQFTTVRAKHADYVKIARPLEKVLDHVLLNDINIYNPLNDCVLELEKYGTGIARTGFKKIVRTAVRYNDKGEEEEFDVVTKNGPTVDAVPNSRFLMPFFYQNIEDSPWVGEEMTASLNEVRSMEDSGMFKKGTYDKIYNFRSAIPNRVEENQRELESAQPVLGDNRPLEWAYIWLSFDVVRKNDIIQMYGDATAVPPGGSDREIVVHYHKESQTIMSCRYNWHNDLRRPYYKGVYFPVEHRWNGVGICKQLNQFQREITTQHRQRLDNATLANVRMIKVNKFSGYGPNEPIFPGKIWFLDNMTDVETFQLGEIYPSAYSNEHQTLQYAQQRSGVNELNLGMPQVGTPGTATAELSRVQESNKKFDFTYGNVRKFASSIVIDVAAQLQQFGPREQNYYDKIDDGNLVKKFMELPATLIKDGILCEIAVAGQKDNDLLDRQNWQQVSQMLQTYYTQILQIAQLTGDKAMIQLITQQAYEGATEAMKQILESFDIKNVDRLIVAQLLKSQPNDPTNPNTQFGAGTQPSLFGAPQGIHQSLLPAGQTQPA